MFLMHLYYCPADRCKVKEEIFVHSGMAAGLQVSGGGGEPSIEFFLLSVLSESQTSRYFLATD